MILIELLTDHYLLVDGPMLSTSPKSIHDAIEARIVETREYKLCYHEIAHDPVSLVLFAGEYQAFTSSLV